MASLILGIAGKKRAGKNAFAARLVARHGFTPLAFADALKASIEDLDPWVSVEADEVGLLYGSGAMYLRTQHHRLSHVLHLIGWEHAKDVREVRRLLQEHGVSIRNHVDPDVWVNAVARKAEEIDGPVCITDVRFPNEAHFVDRYRLGDSGDSSGQVVRIVRPGLDSTDTHASEIALDGYPAINIRNDGDVADLHAKADLLVEQFGL